MRHQPTRALSHAPSDNEHNPLISPAAGMADQDRPSLFARIKRNWHKASAAWIIPVVLFGSLCRGMTMAPRVDVYTQIACRALESQNASGDHIPSAFSPGLPPMPYAQNQSASVHVVYAGPATAPNDCTADPNEVQARAARIQASVKTTESILAALTTGWLSHQSDIYGRKKLLVISVFGALFMDFVYILVSSKSNTIFSRHGEAFIIAAPFVEGLLGAQSTFSGLTHAYASDCFSEGSRSQIFVMMQGMLYVGLAVGPWVDGAILNFAKGSNNETLFATSIGIALFHIFFIISILPESLPAHSRYPSMASTVSTQSDDDSHKMLGYTLWKRLRYFIKALLYKPIAILFPQRIEGRNGYDWNLTLTGIALFIYILSIQVYNLKYLYVKHVYGWNSEYLGYYMSLLFVTRAITLLLILPSILAYFAPKRPQAGTSTPDLASAIRFDRAVAAISFFTDATANALVVLSPTSSQVLFIFFTSLNSITSGGNPALHSLGAVSLQAMGKGVEIGLVFGAMGLVNSASHIIAPWIYAYIYGATVAVFPKAMFLLSAVLLYLAVCTLLGVRPDRQFRPDDSEYRRAPTEDGGRAHEEGDEDVVSSEEESDEVDADEAEVRRRGRRSRRSMSGSMTAEEIDKARHASLARMSFSENT